MSTELEELKALRKARRAEIGMCLCGCGELCTSRGALFRQGHDQRLAVQLRKVERGEATIEQLNLDRQLLRLLVPCSRCGRPIIPHPSGMGPVCRTKLL